ncbi:hypothetical protein AUP68_09219 [Ilyonectria robusta]
MQATQSRDRFAFIRSLSGNSTRQVLVPGSCVEDNLGGVERVEARCTIISWSCRLNENEVRFLLTNSLDTDYICVAWMWLLRAALGILRAKGMLADLWTIKADYGRLWPIITLDHCRSASLYVLATMPASPIATLSAAATV